ncbi:hypothetical protein UA08_06187 [Talaromyces atroroseus]|uniref:Uncharacterized protein n=1 Tax=Talaromyces atroroseus TaxID=1441469 RepID=A0A225AN73_TALAT|nr:hypothetical protein UA08_06187 [Talaromyces atroroseus]OKL58738.1 hypothetical protein UA08_06187 [Talaromyces atroroseus]
MEDQAQGQIERILDHSLDNLSAEDVMELRRTSERSPVLDKVSPAEYLNWLDKVGDDIRGAEYDAQNACIVLKGCPGWMHEAAADVVREVFYQIRDRLSAATGSDYILTGSTDCLLVDKYDGSIKQADASLMEFEAEWPVVVLEVGINETTEKLCGNANRWLNGSDGDTKLVILINVQEIGHKALRRHILDWYGSKNIRLHGSFELSVDLWYSDGVGQCILNKAAFSRDNLIDLMIINDVPIDTPSPGCQLGIWRWHLSLKTALFVLFSPELRLPGLKRLLLA